MVLLDCIFRALAGPAFVVFSWCLASRLTCGYWWLPQSGRRAALVKPKEAEYHEVDPGKYASSEAVPLPRDIELVSSECSNGKKYYAREETKGDGR